LFGQQKVIGTWQAASGIRKEKKKITLFTRNYLSKNLHEVEDIGDNNPRWLAKEQKHKAMILIGIANSGYYIKPLLHRQAFPEGCAIQFIPRRSPTLPMNSCKSLCFWFKLVAIALNQCRKNLFCL